MALPSEVEIPDNMITFDTDANAISDYISDKIGFCHAGFKIECNMTFSDLEREYHKLNEVEKKLEAAMAFVDGLRKKKITGQVLVIFLCNDFYNNKI